MITGGRVAQLIESTNSGLDQPSRRPLSTARIDVNIMGLAETEVLVSGFCLCVAAYENIRRQSVDSSVRY